MCLLLSTISHFFAKKKESHSHTVGKNSLIKYQAHFFPQNQIFLVKISIHTLLLWNKEVSAKIFERRLWEWELIRSVTWRERETQSETDSLRQTRGHVILNSNTHYTLEVKRDRETQPDSFRQTRGHVKLSQKLIRSVSCKGPWSSELIRSLGSLQKCHLHCQKVASQHIVTCKNTHTNLQHISK